MKRKILELEGVELDAVVAKALGHLFVVDGGHVTVFDWQRPGSLVRGNPFEPSINWCQGGPILEHARIDLSFSQGMIGGRGHCAAWKEFWYLGPSHTGGPTALIAAMRCFVLIKLPEEFEQ